MITKLFAQKRTYHPDPEINAEIAAVAVKVEIMDQKIGFPARRWICDCGASHRRGFFMSPGVHRCLSCGYVGTDGIMVDEEEFASLISLGCEIILKSPHPEFDGSRGHVIIGLR